jgi:hypothetical protein
LFRLYYRRDPEHIPQMGEFFLLQMDDSFTEGLCFDIRKEGDGGALGWRSPNARRAKRRPRWMGMREECGHYSEEGGCVLHGEGTRPPLGLLYVASMVGASAIGTYPYDV